MDREQLKALGIVTEEPRVVPFRGERKAPRPSLLRSLLSLAAGLLAMVLGINLLFLLLSKPDNAKEQPTSQPQATPTVAAKATSPYYVVRGFSYAWSDSEAGSELHDHVTADNSQAIDRMLAEGRAMLLRPGTRLSMVDVGLMSHTVRVVDGQHAGRRCIVAAESIENE